MVILSLPLFFHLTPKHPTPLVHHHHHLTITVTIIIVIVINTQLAATRLTTEAKQHNKRERQDTQNDGASRLLAAPAGRLLGGGGRGVGDARARDHPDVAARPARARAGALR
jgi:hypothetical protein